MSVPQSPHRLVVGGWALALVPALLFVTAGDSQQATREGALLGLTAMSMGLWTWLRPDRPALLASLVFASFWTIVLAAYLAAGIRGTDLPLFSLLALAYAIGVTAGVIILFGVESALRRG